MCLVLSKILNHLNNIVPTSYEWGKAFAFLVEEIGSPGIIRITFKMPCFNETN